MFALIRCEVNTNQITAIATDKYSLAVATYEIDTDIIDDVFYIDADAAKFIAGLKAPRYGSFPVEFDFGVEEIRISYDGQSITQYSQNTAYPPVVDMIHHWQAADAAADLAINMQRVATYSKLIGSDGKKIEKWVMKLGANAANPAKPAPLRFEAGEITILSQPMML